MPFCLTDLIRDYKLYDHYHLIGNMVDALIGRRSLEVCAPSSVHVTAFRSGSRYLVHLVNESGERPLRDTLPVAGIRVSLQLPEGCRPATVRAVLENQDITWKCANGRVEMELRCLKVCRAGLTGGCAGRQGDQKSVCVCCIPCMMQQSTRNRYGFGCFCVAIRFLG